jgi:hypothetical protein
MASIGSARYVCGRWMGLDLFIYLLYVGTYLSIP